MEHAQGHQVEDKQAEHLMQYVKPVKKPGLLLKFNSKKRLKMAKKYLITPKKQNTLIQKEFYRKGKKFFYIETVWYKPEIVVDKKPNLKAFNPTEGFLLNTFKFKSGELDSKSKLVVPDNIVDTEAKKIKNEYRKYGYIFDIEGWESAETEIRVFGDLDIEETPYHLITLFSSEIEVLLMKISKDQYQSYLSEGLPQDQYDELEQNAEISGSIYDESTIIDIDGTEIPNFHKLFKPKYIHSVKEYEKKYGTKLNNKNKKVKIEYAVVGERWIKRSWFTLEIFEEFDISNLKIEISRDVYFGRTDYIDTFSLNYAGKEFEFKENYGADSDDYYLMTSAGERNHFDIIDSDEEDLD
jgi:hypothetical protein